MKEGKSSGIVCFSVGGKTFKPEFSEVKMCSGCMTLTNLTVGRHPVCSSQACYDKVVPRAVKDYPT